MLFWNKICGFAAIFYLVSFSAKAQIITPANYNTTELSLTNPYLNKSVIPKAAITTIPKNFYTQHFGLMCRQELQLEKATKIPFRFRLGSLQQCNYYEGKR
jgi:hypothetical protein